MCGQKLTGLARRISLASKVDSELQHYRDMEGSQFMANPHCFTWCNAVSKSVPISIYIPRVPRLHPLVQDTRYLSVSEVHSICESSALASATAVEFRDLVPLGML
jgi:hypothetical protein